MTRTWWSSHADTAHERWQQEAEDWAAESGPAVSAGLPEVASNATRCLCGLVFL